MVGGVLLRSAKVFGSRFPRFYQWWDVKPPGRGEDFYHLSRVSFPLSQSDFFFCLFFFFLLVE